MKNFNKTKRGKSVFHLRSQQMWVWKGQYLNCSNRKAIRLMSVSGGAFDSIILLLCILFWMHTDKVIAMGNLWIIYFCSLLTPVPSPYTVCGLHLVVSAEKRNVTGSAVWTKDINNWSLIGWFRTRLRDVKRNVRLTLTDSIERDRWPEYHLDRLQGVVHPVIPKSSPSLLLSWYGREWRAVIRKTSDDFLQK